MLEKIKKMVREAKLEIHFRLLVYGKQGPFMIPWLWSTNFPILQSTENKHCKLAPLIMWILHSSKRKKCSINSKLGRT